MYRIQPGIVVRLQSELRLQAPDDHDLSLRIGPTRHQTCLNLPIFSGLGQFSAHILSLGKQADRPAFQQRICLGQQFGQWRQAPAPSRHRSGLRALFDEILDPLCMDHGRRAGDARRFAQECRLLCRCFRPDGRARPACPRARRRSPSREIRRRSRDRPKFSRPERGQEAAASWRCGGSTVSVRSKARSDWSAAAIPAEARRSGRAGPLFHVKQASAPSARARSAARSGRATCGLTRLALRCGLAAAAGAHARRAASTRPA